MNARFKDPPSATEAKAVLEQLTMGGRDVRDERVLRAMMSIPRHAFVPDHDRAHAYADGPLPIGHGQTISQPYIVGFMTEMLRLEPNDRVLEIGVGCGYQTAVLSELVDHVYGLEIVAPLATRAESALHELGIRNFDLRPGDGFQGWPEEAPFDAILVACAPNRIPAQLLEQLADGGRMIIPVGDRFRGQDLWLVEKRGLESRQTSVLPVRFVPMTGEISTGAD